MQNKSIEEINHSESIRKSLCSLRIISGLTWDHLAKLFGVSSDQIRYWISGRALDAKHEDHLIKTFDVIRIIDRGNADSNRSALLEVHDGVSALDLLANKNFKEVCSRLGTGPGRRDRVIGELSPEEKAARTPLPPEILANAFHDSIHHNPTSGKLISSRQVNTLRTKYNNKLKGKL